MRVFAGEVYKVGLIRFVDVPQAVTRSFDAQGPHVPVCGTVEGIPMQTTLVSRGQGCYRMAVHGDIWKKLKLMPGSVVEIAMQRDEQSREPVLPPALVLALRNAPRAQKQFRGMTTALRRQIVRYLTSAKQQSTVERRVAIFVRRLEKQAATKPAKSHKAQ